MDGWSKNGTANENENHIIPEKDDIPFPAEMIFVNPSTINDDKCSKY